MGSLPQAICVHARVLVKYATCYQQFGNTGVQTLAHEPLKRKPVSYQMMIAHELLLLGLVPSRDLPIRGGNFMSKTLRAPTFHHGTIRASIHNIGQWPFKSKSSSKPRERANLSKQLIHTEILIPSSVLEQPLNPSDCSI